MAIGSATIDFGVSPGGTACQVNVTGQTSILSGSVVNAYLMAETSADHTIDDHLAASTVIGLVCGAVVGGTGFTIYARARLTTIGRYTVRWVWV